MGASNYWTQGAQLRTNAWGTNERLQVKGVSWFGFETATCVLGGASEVSVDRIAAVIKEAGFNAVRLPVGADALLRDDAKCRDDSQYAVHNREMMGLTLVEQVGSVARTQGAQHDAPPVPRL